MAEGFGGGRQFETPAPSLRRRRAQRSGPVIRSDFAKSGCTRLPRLAVRRFFAGAAELQSLVGRCGVAAVEAGHPAPANGIGVRGLGHALFLPQVNVLRKSRRFTRTPIVEKQADFDPNAFVESKFLDTSDPVGSILIDPASADRYIDQNWYYSNGIRKQHRSPARKSNSPRKSAMKTATRSTSSAASARNVADSLSITQPLLNGAGKAYNSRLIVLAQIDAQIRATTSRRIFRSPLLEVYQAYWDLHLQRALLLQKRKLYERGVEICRELEGRRDIDAVGGQLARAKAAVASRYGAVVRQETDLLNADAKLRTLINDPELLLNRGQELIPMQPPLRDALPLSFQDSLIVALHHRPEINEARTELKAACVRQDVAKNELLPVLNLILIDLRQRIGRRREHDSASVRRSIHPGPPHLLDRQRPSRFRWATAPLGPSSTGGNWRSFS